MFHGSLMQVFLPQMKPLAIIFKTASKIKTVEKKQSKQLMTLFLMVVSFVSTQSRLAMQMQLAKMKMMMMLSKRWCSDIQTAHFLTGFRLDKQNKDLNARLTILFPTRNSPSLNSILLLICDIVSTYVLDSLPQC